MEHRISQKNQFSGGMNTDDAQVAMPENDYISATNVRGSVNQEQHFQIKTNIKGNTLTSYSLPSGYNKVIGAYEDLFLNTIFYFVYNSNGDHSILRYYPITNTIQKVVTDSVFDWTVDTNITHVDFVNGEFLYWIDPQPREISVLSATDDKQREYILTELVFLDTAPLEFFTLTLYDDNGVAIFTAVSIQAQDYDDLANLINVLFNNGIGGDYLIAESCHDYVKVTIKGINTYTLTYESTSGQNTAIAVPNNFYPAYTERTIYRGKYPYPCPPEVSPINDPNRGFNLIVDKHFQFMIRMVMKDNSKTVYSPISDISLTNCATNNYNGIRVDFTDTIFSDITFLATLERIEVVAREGNIGKFKRVKTIERFELWDESLDITVQYYDFYNDGNYETIADSDALRPYDAIGREIGGQVFVDNRLFDGNILENYDKPCPDIEIEGTFTESSKQQLFSVIGNVKIWVEDFYGVGNPAPAGFIYNTGVDGDGNPTPDVWGGSRSGEVRTNTAEYGQVIALEQTGFVIYDATNPNIFTISRQDDSHGLPITGTGALSASTAAERQAIVDYIAATTDPNNVFFSNFELKGLAPGVHVLRVASHWCSFGDALNKGSLYDLNGSGYHKTSTSIKTWVEPTTFTQLGDFVYEIRVEIDPNGAYRLYANTNPYTSLPFASGTATNNEIYVGQVFVEDKVSVQDGSDKRLCCDGYLIDAEGSSDNNQLATNGLFMERQLVKLRQSTFTGSGSAFIENEINFITDHNGYWYYRCDGINTDAPGEQTARTTVNVRVESINSLLVRDWVDALKNSPNAYPDNSILNHLFNQTLIDASTPNSISFFSSGITYNQSLIYNNNVDVSRYNRVRIEGVVEDSNNVGLGNISVLYERNGRQELTGADGSFEIIAYGAYDLAAPLGRTRVTDNIIINNPNDCELRFNYAADPNSLFYLVAPQIISFGYPQAGTLYGDPTVPPLDPALQNYDLGIITATLVGSSGNRYLKNGGAYQFALLYVDDMFRRCDLVLSDKLLLPFTTENRNKIQGIVNTLTSGASNGFFTFTMSIGGTPPGWAKYVFVLRTLNAAYNYYLQFPLNDVKYVVDYDGTNVQETTYETSTATQIWLNLAESLSKYQFKYPDSQLGYTFTEGDRVRFITDQNGNLITDNGQPTLLDLKIVGEQAIGDSVYLVVENLDTLPKLEGGTLVEVYTPKLNIETEAFYEIHKCIEITGGAYSTPTFALDTGDSYLRTRIVPVENGVAVNQIQSSSISDFYVSDFQDIGRVSFPNPDFKEIRRTNAIRFSGKFYEDTKINNLSSFELLNIEQTPKFMGAINAMEVTNDDNYRAVILVICENNTASAYVGDALISDVAGSDVISLSSKVLPAIRILKGDFGTTHPGSVASRDGTVYWWCSWRKTWVRYALNGLFPISDYKFVSFSEGIRPDRVEGIIDVHHQMYITTGWNVQTGTAVAGVLPNLQVGVIITVTNASAFTVGQQIQVNEEDKTVEFVSGNTISFSGSSDLGEVEIRYNMFTATFDEPNKRWNDFRTYTPVKYGMVGEKFVAFKRGALWLMDSNTIYNNFFGVQYESDITFVFNPESAMVKLWYNMRVMANSRWYCPELSDIELLPNASYPTGMQSRAKSDQFSLIEGQWHCAFLRDANDPRYTNQLQALLQGRNLRGEVMKVRLQNDSTSLATLRFAEAFTYPSMLTEA